MTVTLQTIRAAKDGDEKSIAAVMDKYSNLINKVKMKYHAKGYDEDDFESLAKIGIWNAINRFDERKLRYVYNRKTKTWRVHEKSFKSLLSACVKNNVLRLTARRWRADKKIKRKGDEYSYDQMLNTGADDEQHETNLMDKRLFEKISADQQFSTLLLDVDKCFQKMHKVIWCFLFEGYDRKEIAKMLNCSPSFIRHNIKEMQSILTSRDLITA